MNDAYARCSPRSTDNRFQTMAPCRIIISATHTYVRGHFSLRADFSGQFCVRHRCVCVSLCLVLWEIMCPFEFILHYLLLWASGTRGPSTVHTIKIMKLYNIKQKRKKHETHSAHHRFSAYLYAIWFYGLRAPPTVGLAVCG